MTTFELPQEWINELTSARNTCHAELTRSTRLSGHVLAEEALVAVTVIGDLLAGSVIPIIPSTVDEGTDSTDTLEGEPGHGQAGQSPTIDPPPSNGDGDSSESGENPNPFADVTGGGL